MEIFKTVIDPVLTRLDSERMHTLARESLHLAESTRLSEQLLRYFSHRRNDNNQRCEKLRVQIAGISFDNPLVVGAGWDKEGRSVRALYDLGFSGVEVGSVLLRPQPGNPKPRQFILAKGVALNSLGFNSPGMERVASNLERYKFDNIPLGINIGKNKEIEPKDAPEAYAKVAARLYSFASYFVVNVSSPNTPGLRELQEKELLTGIVQAVNDAMEKSGGRKPLFVKIAPELTLEATDDVIRVAIDNKISGIIATNTTNNPELKAKYGERWRNQPGGLSGDDADYRKLATDKIRHIYKQAGSRLEIMGIGGIKDTATALEKITAGAKVIQVVTGIRGEGPSIAGKINLGLLEFMDAHGIKSISELIGSETDSLTKAVKASVS